MDSNNVPMPEMDDKKNKKNKSMPEMIIHLSLDTIVSLLTHIY